MYMHALEGSSEIWMGNFYGKYQKTFQELFLLFKRITQDRKLKIHFFQPIHSRIVKKKKSYSVWYGTFGSFVA